MPVEDNVPMVCGALLLFAGKDLLLWITAKDGADKHAAAKAAEVLCATLRSNDAGAQMPWERLIVITINCDDDSPKRADAIAAVIGAANSVLLGPLR